MDPHLESTVKEGLEQEMPRVHAGLRTFTHLRIDNIGRLNKTPYAGTFRRTLTFLAARTSALFTKDTPLAPFESWEPLNNRRRGTATVYSATVRSSTNFDLAETVCVKMAKWSRNRSLAREGWYYEQLSREANCERVAAPRCFGHFVVYGADPPEAISSTITPWKHVEYGDEDILTEDYDLYPGNTSLRDEYGFAENCRWYDFNQDEDVAICVLVLEELGAAYPSPSMDDEALRGIREILEDLVPIGIVHEDARFNNVLRILVSDSNSFCSRHKKIHNWRLVDFDRATRFFITDSNPNVLSYYFELQFKDFNKGQKSYFMRGIPS
ncbi:hypothetical protein M413DRAFT_32012 [Hebeloma cylindrosporum]|uniref:Protein kinase domain-containing protein n=1 Tax=Hebeloma cylindrosporum TaxID=76867 RepID=A0A0C2XE02_HEBCY|nr:hypothetical protein M413DRAFT_32012 [Hebeloma cylindrosporum h7]